MENAMQIRNFKSTSHTTQNFEAYNGRKKPTTNVRIMRLTCIILQNSKYNEERVLPLKKTETENYLNILFLIKSRKKNYTKKRRLAQQATYLSGANEHAFKSNENMKLRLGEDDKHSQLESFAMQFSSHSFREWNYIFTNAFGCTVHRMVETRFHETN